MFTIAGWRLKMPLHRLFPLQTTTPSRLSSSWWMKVPRRDRLTAPTLVVMLSLCLFLIPFPSYAGMDAEIEHLLNYIETADCTFNRNGTIHDNRDAAAHIRKKYANTKRWIKTTEDFIRYAATKSSITGRPYQVICDGVETPTADWLAKELDRFRENTQ
jgi:hypothetical protein